MVIFTPKATRKKCMGPQKGRRPEVDKELLKFMQVRRKSVLPVTSDKIMVKVELMRWLQSVVYQGKFSWLCGLLYEA